MKKRTGLYKIFLQTESASAILLLVLTFVSLILANIFDAYTQFWNQYTVAINDGLMTFFFLLIGLEIERELYVGELSSLKKAILPIFAAIGGMLFPALIHLSLNYNTATASGVGIPVATDIAFSLAVLSLLGNKVPLSLKIFLTALAIIDDIGAVLIIALFYAKGFSALYFFLSLAIYLILIFMNRNKVHLLWPYLLFMLVMWYCMLKSGIHPTICGILVAFAIPFSDGKEKSLSYRLQHGLHKPVAFFVLPLFAIANTAIAFDLTLFSSLLSSNSLGIILGLALGKPLGIVLASSLAIRCKIASLPKELTFSHITGAGIVAGIGFTMSIFIALLAFVDPHLINESKIAIVLASLIAGGAGYIFLNFTATREKKSRVAS